MKILHLTDHLPDYHQPWGGAEKVAYRHINILTGEKNVKVFVGATKPIKPVKEKFKFKRIRTIEDLFPKNLHLYITGLKNQVLPFDPIAFVSVLAAVLKIKPDIIHLHKTNKISFAPILVGKLFKIPVVLAIYDYWYFCPGAMLIDADARLCHRFHGRWCARCSATKKFRMAAVVSSFYRRRLFDWFYSLVNSFLVLSQFNVSLLKKYGISPDKIFVVRQVYNPPTEKAKNNIKMGNIYMNAWMAPHKGAHIIIQALSEIVKEIPRVSLTLETKILEPDYYSKIKKMIKKYKLENNIEILERQTVADYLSRISQANAVVVAEQWENMAPTTLSDALSRGKPVVAANIGGLPEMFENEKGGLLAVYNDPLDYARKLIKIIKSPRLALRLAKNAPIKIEKMGSVKIIKSQLLRAYDACRIKNH